MKIGFVHLTFFSLVAGLYLALSGAPPRVDILALACLALGLLAPALTIWSFRAHNQRIRLAFAGTSMFSAMLLWDAMSCLVILKVEPFAILRFDPWLYLLGLAALSGLVALSLGAAMAASRSAHAHQ